MKRFSRLLLFTLLASSLTLFSADSVPAIGIADYAPGDAANGIAATRHNLGAGGHVLHTNATTEICIFCHTPHHGKSNAPLWNRVNNATYTAYGSTIAGTQINNADVGGATLACLSCHDGVTQFDVLVNAPGKGNNGVDTTAPLNMNWKFQMANNPGFKNSQWDHFDTSTSGPCYICHVSLFGGGNPADRLSVGTDLTNDHPVSVVYHEDRASLRSINTVIASIDLTSGLASSASTSTNLNQNLWAINGYIDNGTATIANLLRNGKVECSSCHDPHFKNLSWDEVERTWDETWCASAGGVIADVCPDGLFLRRIGGNSGSGVCRTCHNK